MARTQQYGATALARELGADHSNVARMMREGKSPDEIRAKYAARAELKRRGIGVRGKPLTAAPGACFTSDASQAQPANQPDSSSESIQKIADSLAEIRLRKETALTIATEIANEQKRGELVPVAWVRSWCSEAIKTFSGFVTRLPTELRDRLAAESDPFAVESMLANELHHALEILSRLQWPTKTE